jgi:hypothetical protein
VIYKAYPVYVKGENKEGMFIQRFSENYQGIAYSLDEGLTLEVAYHYPLHNRFFPAFHFRGYSPGATFFRGQDKCTRSDLPFSTSNKISTSLVL